MRVLIAPHHFGSIFTPDVVARALATGWLRARSGDEVHVHPHSDGSKGFLEVVPGKAEFLTVRFRGQAHPVKVMRVAKGENQWHTVYCHTDSLMTDHRPDEASMKQESSLPMGELLVQLLERKARRIIIGAGHAPWHDGGAGVLLRLGEHFSSACANLDLRTKSGEINARIADCFDEVRHGLREVSLVVASAREVPYRGLHGAGAELSQAHDVSPQGAQEIEALAADFVTAIDAKVKAATEVSLLADAPPVLLSRRSFAGSGGGVSFICAALGAALYPGSWVTGEETGLNEALDEVDLVVTGAEVVAGEELGEGVVADVAGRASSRAIPVVVVGAQVDASKRQLFKVGVHAAYPVIDTRSDRPQITARAITESDLEARGERLAKTWSR